MSDQGQTGRARLGAAAAALIIAGAVSACGGGGSGTAEPDDMAPVPSAVSAPPSPAATTPVTPAAPSDSAAPEPAVLSDGSFTSTQPVLSDALGSFGGTGRVTNTSDAEKSGIFTYTLFKAGQQVGSMQGAANAVGAGETATVQLISTDDYADGVDKVEFQVDAEY
jgi:hypothetical protein